MASVSRSAWPAKRPPQAVSSSTGHVLLHQGYSSSKRTARRTCYPPAFSFPAPLYFHGTTEQRSPHTAHLHKARRGVALGKPGCAQAWPDALVGRAHAVSLRCGGWYGWYTAAAGLDVNNASSVLQFEHALDFVNSCLGTDTVDDAATTRTHSLVLEWS